MGYKKLSEEEIRRNINNNLQYFLKKYTFFDYMNEKDNCQGGIDYLSNEENQEKYLNPDTLEMYEDWLEEGVEKVLKIINKDDTLYDTAYFVLHDKECLSHVKKWVETSQINDCVRQHYVDKSNKENYDYIDDLYRSLNKYFPNRNGWFSSLNSFIDFVIKYVDL